MTQTLGNGQLPNVEERIGELMLTTELTRACIRAAEADAKLDQWGVMCPDPLMAESPRNLMMTAYPRMIEIVQLLGSSSFMLTPSEADFKGPLKADIEQYLATDTTAGERAGQTVRLAWDLAGNAFGSRQVLYERFFASDPLTRARALASIYPKQEVMDRVLEFSGATTTIGEGGKHEKADVSAARQSLRARRRALEAMVRGPARAAHLRIPAGLGRLYVGGHRAVA